MRAAPVFFTPRHAEDAEAIATLLQRAFGPKRLALPSYALRHGPPVDTLSWTARSVQGDVLGSLQFWRVGLSGQERRCVLLGPLAVDQAYRGAGVARALVRFGLNRAQDRGFELCFVVGEPRFYRLFGFTNAGWSGIDSEAAIPRRRLQVLELDLGALAKLPRRSRLGAKGSQVS